MFYICIQLDLHITMPVVELWQESIRFYPNVLNMIKWPAPKHLTQDHFRVSCALLEEFPALLGTENLWPST